MPWDLIVKAAEAHTDHETRWIVLYVKRRLDALAHPVRLRLVRTLTRSSHTTSELAFAWDLTAPEVSRHLAVLRRAGLLTTERRGRYVHYSVDFPALTALGADLLAAMLS